MEGTRNRDAPGLKYNPEGNRIWKQSVVSGQTTTRKYIVDIAGDLPVILMEIDPTNSSIKKTYIHANGQILAQHDGPYTASRYFYLHDRLGSVRQVINTSGNVVRYHTYNPFGETIEAGGSLSSNSFMFTGQYYDVEIAEYYLRARQYDPHIARFTSRDPVAGEFTEPLTLHKYLYCINDPVNCTDAGGLWTIHVMLSGMFSFGPSLMYQKGIVFDEYGNVGWIVTSNDPHPIEGLDKDWGLGLGVPAASAGVAFGWTNADTIFDLQGAGISIGGSLTPYPPFSIGVDYIKGIQRSGEYYHGFEVTPGVSTPGWEVHGQATWTTVRQWESNRQEGLDTARESIENSIFNAQTLGQAEALLSIWSYLP